MKIGELCHDHQKIETKMYENVHGSKFRREALN